MAYQIEIFREAPYLEDILIREAAYQNEIFWYTADQNDFSGEMAYQLDIFRQLI